jgi:hypothetical protein
MAINDWDKHDGGIYKQHFAKGFKAGRMNKINHDNKQYNLNLKLMKDGSIRHGEQGVAEDDLNELSTEKLAQYKTAASADARKADAAGDYARGDKRFKGINQATIKQFDNDLKKHGQQGVAEGADYHDMVARVKQLAGMGPLNTGYDPNQRVYKNMPTAVQPKKEQR